MISLKCISWQLNQVFGSGWLYLQPTHLGKFGSFIILMPHNWQWFHEQLRKWKFIGYVWIFLLLLLSIVFCILISYMKHLHSTHRISLVVFINSTQSTIYQGRVDWCVLWRPINLMMPCTCKPYLTVNQIHLRNFHRSDLVIYIQWILCWMYSWDDNWNIHISYGFLKAPVQMGKSLACANSIDIRVNAA